MNALFANEVDALLINSVYVDILLEMEGYMDFQDRVKCIWEYDVYQTVEESDVENVVEAQVLETESEKLVLELFKFCFKLFCCHISDFCNFHGLYLLFLSYELTFDGELVRCKTHSFLSYVLCNSVHLKHNSAGLNYCYPVFR